MGDSAELTKLTNPDMITSMLIDRTGYTDIGDWISMTPQWLRPYVRLKVKENPVAEVLWVIREAMRFTLKDYAPIRFTPRNEVEERLLMRLHENVGHFVHLSKNEPLYIAYTPSEEYGKQDRRVKTTVGRYLKKCWPDMPDSEVRELTDVFRLRFGIEDIKFATTPEEIVKVYTKGPSSCMSYAWTPNSERYGSQMHPAEIYAQPWLKVAYLERNGKINARALVYTPPNDPNDKRLIRVYGDEVLRLKLENAGYRLGTLQGCHLPKIPALLPNGVPLPETWVMPYLDDHSDGNRLYQGLTTDGENWKIISRQSGGMEYIATNTSGLIGRHSGYQRCTGNLHISASGRLCRELRACACCSDNYDRDELRYSNHSQEWLCQSCISTHYVAAYHTIHGDRTLVRREHTIQVDNSYYVDSEEVRTAFGIRKLTHPKYTEAARTRYFRNTVLTTDGHVIEPMHAKTFPGNKVYAIWDIATLASGDVVYPDLDLLAEDVAYVDLKHGSIKLGPSPATSRTAYRYKTIELWLAQIARDFAPAVRVETIVAALPKENIEIKQIVINALNTLLQRPEYESVREQALQQPLPLVA